MTSTVRTTHAFKIKAAASWSPGLFLCALTSCSAAEGDVATTFDEVASSSAVEVAADSDRARPDVPRLEWTACADGFECATVAVPRDYAHPHGRKFNLAATRLPARNAARRIGSLFVNFGGPGRSTVTALHTFGKVFLAAFNERFDIVGIDPRGTAGDLELDCKVNQETEGLYAQPFTTPYALTGFVERARRYVKACVRANEDVLPYIATANGARDMDLLRAALGEAKLSYLGFSHGTFLGATYASLFPARYRALVLDGALDADSYINRPIESMRRQTAGLERALDRFFEACAANQEACSGFGGDDPHAAFDELVAQANASPIPAGGANPVPVDGDDLLWISGGFTSNKRNWPLFAQIIASARDGDGTPARALVDNIYGRREDGSYTSDVDRYYALSAAEQRYPSDIETFKDVGREAYGLFDHHYWNSGYSELAFGLLPIKARGVFYGPFRASASAPTVVVVGTTYDPGTPYRGAVSLVAQLGNARLLTMRGDGHTAYGGNSPCIDAAVEAYLNEGILPPLGQECEQEVPFEAPALRQGRNIQIPGLNASDALPSTVAELRSDMRFINALR